MADSYNFTETAIVDTMTFSLSSPLTGTATFSTTGFTDTGWNISQGSGTNDLTVSSDSVAVAPNEFSLSFSSLPAGSTIDFKAINGNDSSADDSALLTFNGSTWAVIDHPGISGDIIVAPEPSLSLLLGLGLGAVTLTLGWKKG
jgi:hypothetical protein